MRLALASDFEPGWSVPPKWGWGKGYLGVILWCTRSRQFLEASGPGQAEQTILTHLPPTPSQRTDPAITKASRAFTALANVCCVLTLCQACVRGWEMEGTQCCPAGEKGPRCDRKVGPSQVTGCLWLGHPCSLAWWLGGPQDSRLLSPGFMQPVSESRDSRWLAGRKRTGPELREGKEVFPR